MTTPLSEEFISSELEKIKYLYGLNRVIRFNLKRKEEFQTQSVAEHITNMIYLAFYFRPLEDQNDELNFYEVIKLIMFHDLGEIETGDIITVIKSSDDEKKEGLALETVKQKSPKYIADEVDRYLAEFNNPKTREGKFAQAIDKFEGQMFWIDKENIKMAVEAINRVGVQAKVVHPIHMKKVFKMLDEYHFPIIKKYLEIIEKIKYSYGIIE